MIWLISLAFLVGIIIGFVAGYRSGWYDLHEAIEKAEAIAAEERT